MKINKKHSKDICKYLSKFIKGENLLLTVNPLEALKDTMIENKWTAEHACFIFNTCVENNLIETGNEFPN